MQSARCLSFALMLGFFLILICTRRYMHNITTSRHGEAWL